MAVTPGLARALEAAALEEAATHKARYVGRIQAILDAVAPPLSPLELSVGLGLDEPSRSRSSTVSRWLSTAPRNLKSLPDELMRALIERLFAGFAVMAVGPGKDTHGLRPLVFCEPWEAQRLSPEWHVARLSQHKVVERAPTGAPGVIIDLDPDGPESYTADSDRPALTHREPRPEPNPTTDPTRDPNAAPADEAHPDDPTPAHGFDPDRPIVAAPRVLFRPDGPTIPPLGLGVMRLSTANKEGHRPDEVLSIAIIQRALDLGLRLIDTADSYALDDKDMHHSERLIRRAVGTWHSQDRESVVVATKCGLTRPGGRWLPNGRPDHLERMAIQSLQALGVDALDLLQLHVKDPRVPYEDSLGALVRLYESGKVKKLGVCNVTVDDLRKALAILPKEAFATVQNQLNPFDTASARGIVALTREHGLTLLAHSPLGGHAGVHRIQKKDALAEVATRHGLDASAGRHPVALSWLMTLGAHVIPVFGATRQTSVEASFAALQLQLSDDDLKLLDETFPKAAALRDEPLPAAPAGALLSESASAIEVSAEPLPAPGDAPEIVMILGIPGAGKSSLVAPYLDKGYLRLNRDELGGKLDDLVPALRNALASGRKRVVLDNTYPTIKSRLGVLESGRLANVPVRCLWLDTSLEDARWNACLRMLERHGRLLSPDEIAVLSKTEPNTIPPVAQQVWLKNFEPPSGHEGFAQIERRPFVRHARPDRTKRGLLLDVDGTLRVTRSGEKYPRDVGDVMLLPNRRQILAEWHQQGYRLFFVSNQSGISSGKLESRNAEAAFHRTIELLNLPVDDVAYCPHKAFPVSCFCRKPMPGLAVKLIEKHGLALEHLHVVGDMKSDAELAKAIGAHYHEAHEFFGDPAPR